MWFQSLSHKTFTCLSYFFQDGFLALAKSSGPKTHLDQGALREYLLGVGDIPVPDGKQLFIELFDTADQSGIIEFMSGDAPCGFAIGAIYYWRANQARMSMSTLVSW